MVLLPFKVDNNSIIRVVKADCKITKYLELSRGLDSHPISYSGKAFKMHTHSAGFKNTIQSGIDFKGKIANQYLVKT